MAHEGMSKKNVTVIGSGNWGMAIAKIIAGNTARHEEFHDDLTVWMFEEEVIHKGTKRKLSELFNETKENVKYLPGHTLANNVKAQPDLKKAVADADILVWVLPHQFVPRTVQNMGPVKEGCVSISLIKGGLELKDGKLGLCSDLLRQLLKHEVGVLMGANVANEVAAGEFCEATLGLKDRAHHATLVKLFDCPSFRVTAVDDIPGVELCGALKNVVALGAGFCDGLGFGGNTKAALIRVGLKEMQKFCEAFYGDRKIKQDTFLESCGLADLVTTCFGGRNRKCADVFAKCITEGTPKDWDTIEAEELNGQKLQGTGTAKDVMTCIKDAKKEAEFPLFCKIHAIAFEGADPKDIVKIN